MFEVGKKYEFCTLRLTEDGLCEHQRQWTVTAVDGTLLHLHIPEDRTSAFAEYAGPTPEQNMVLNTASAFFHSAKLVAEKK